MNPKKITKTISITLLILITIFLIYYIQLPNGRTIQGQEYQISEDSIEFIYDLTYEKNNTITHDHNIFNKITELIQNAEDFLIVDFFLFGTTKQHNPLNRNLTQELTTALINKKQSSPQMPIYFITDDYNVIDKPQNKPFIESLKQNNINIIYTPLNTNSKTLNSLTRSLLKTSRKTLNHRKLLITNIDNQITTLITSANPHDQSSPNSNTAIIIKEKIWKDILNQEIKDANIQDSKIQEFLNNFQEQPTNKSKPITVQYLADNGLIHELKNQIDSTTKGNIINIAMFTLSDKSIINALTKASKRKISINLILDTNDFFFTQRKFGIPNKPISEKLLKDSLNQINIRWYKSHGEQFHTKLITIQNQTHTTILTGSTNIANNNLKLYNLQSDIKITAPNNSSITKNINNYLDKLWTNQNGIYTEDYKIYKSDSMFKKIRYEWSQFTRWFI